MEKDLEKVTKEKNWKNKNRSYLYELQKVLDLVDNVRDKYLKKMLIYQIIKFDRTLTEISEERINNIMEEKQKE